MAPPSGKQAPPEGQCRSWAAVYCTGGPKAESALRQGPRPAFVKTVYTLRVHAQTPLPKVPEPVLNKGKERCSQSSPVGLFVYLKPRELTMDGHQQGCGRTPINVIECMTLFSHTDNWGVLSGRGESGSRGRSPGALPFGAWFSGWFVVL